MDVLTKQERLSIYNLLDSDVQVNIDIAKEIAKRRLPAEEFKELMCIIFLKFWINDHHTPSFRAIMIHQNWRNATNFYYHLEDLARLGFQGTRLLQRNKKHFLQFFCGRSGYSYEMKLDKDIVENMPF